MKERKGCSHLIINLLTIVIFLGLLEVFSRFIMHKIYNRDFDSSLIVDNKYFTSAGLKENAHGTVWGKDFNTDEFGCRKNSEPYNKAKKKWLFIGDSVTEGAGVDDSSAFSSLVAARVDSLNIMNYSLIGYSVNDYYNVVKSVLPSLGNTVERVTVFYCLNDVYGSAKTKDLPVMARQNLLGRANSLLQSKYYTYKLAKLVWFRNADRYYQYDAQFYDRNNKRFMESMGYLLSCDSLCRASGLAMEVVVLPYRSQVKAPGRQNEQAQRFVTEYCQQHKIPVFDPLQQLKSQKDPNSLYLFSDEIHFSEEGHKAIARFILSL